MDTPDAPTLTGAVIMQSEAELSENSSKVDAAGNTFVASMVGGASSYALVLKIAPDGTISQWPVYPGGPSGGRLAGVSLSASGADLLVIMTSHDNNSNKPRPNYVSEAIIPGVYVPYAGGEPGDGRGVFMPSGGGGEPVPQPGATGAELVAALTVALERDRALRLVLGGLIQSASRGAADAALVAAFGAGGAYYTGDGVHGRISEAVYKVMLDHGLIKPKQ